MINENPDEQDSFMPISWPDYYVHSLADTSPPLSDAITDLNLSKLNIKYIKSFLETENNLASEMDIVLLTTGTFNSLRFETRLSQKDIEEVFSMKNALQHLKTNIYKPVTADLVYEYNSLVITGPKRIFAGRLRETNVTIDGTSYRPPDFHLLPRLFDNMFDSISLIEGSVNKAISYLLAISKNQFFIDGNKRTARLVALHQLAHTNQRLFNPSLDTADYLYGLKRFYETGDPSQFTEFISKNLYTIYELSELD